jgi:hypothetical protein
MIWPSSYIFPYTIELLEKKLREKNLVSACTIRGVTLSFLGLELWDEIDFMNNFWRKKLKRELREKKLKREIKLNEKILSLLQVNLCISLLS